MNKLIDWDKKDWLFPNTLAKFIYLIQNHFFQVEIWIFQIELEIISIFCPPVSIAIVV